MALREGTRRWAMRAAWAGLLTAMALLVGLRLGRPLYYTDGLQQVDAPSLAASGMVRWGTPEVRIELPGPVAGRVAELPDGRFVYGRMTADGTSDLVLFDPTRPTVAPEPAYGQNSPQNELAPALGPDGRLYFASDRPGTGGYDLYVSLPGPGGFAAPVPLSLTNTALDETDPAPHGNGEDFVFVRIDRQRDEGRGGQLWRCRLTDVSDPIPVFAADGRGRTAATDRDPVFAPGGGALWFVRKERSAPLQLVRASYQAGHFDAPLPIGARWGTGELRGPLPHGSGLRLGLLQPAVAPLTADLWFVSEASEVYPWWPGQRWLEWILLAAIGVSALLLVLLHLGRRWSSLDFVVQCLLLSLLLHVLLFLWLWGVEISGALAPGDDEQGAMQVDIQASVTAASATAVDASSLPTDVSERITFAMQDRAIDVVAPGSAPERHVAVRTIAAAEAERDGAAAARELVATALVQDAAAAPPQRQGSDPEATTTAAELPTVTVATSASAAAAEAVRLETGPVAVGARAPEPAVEPSIALANVLAASAVLDAAETTPDLARTEAPAAPLQDRIEPAALPPLRAAAAAAAAELAPVTSEVEPAVGMGPAVARTATTANASAPAQAPAPLVARPDAAPIAAAAPTTLPHDDVLRPRDAKVPTTLRDDAGAAAAAVVLRAAPAAAAAPVVAAASTAVDQAAAVAPSAARADARTGVVPEPIPALDPPAAALTPRTGQVTVASPERAPAAAAGRMVANVPPATVRDAAAPATAAGPAAASHRNATAPRGPAPAAVAVDVRPAAAASPAPARAVVPGHAAAVVPAPNTGVDRAASRAPAAAASSLPAPRRSSKAAGAAVVVVLREGDAAPLVTASTGTAPAERDRSVPLPALPAVARAATGTTTSSAARAIGTLAEPLPFAVPPTTGLERPGRAISPPVTPPPAAAPFAGQRPVARRLRDGMPIGGVAVATPLPANEAVLEPPALLAMPVPSPGGSGVDRPRRSPVPAPATAPIAVVKPPPSLLERAASEPVGPRASVIAASTAYSNRFGPAKAKALEQFGGNEETERAVANGLRYLASIQNGDGTWGDREQYDAKYGSVYIGKTALCVLAFLGAGHTPTSRTEHSPVVARAVAHLLSVQDEDTGAFGPSSSYGHGITTYALTECYGITKAAALLRPVEAALTWILQNQGPRRDRRNRGGWGYFSPGLAREDDYARVSVSAWMIMALESARLSGIDLPPEVLPRAREYLELSFDQQNGWFRYNHKQSRLTSAWPTLPASTPAGAFCLMLLGAGADDSKVDAALGYTVERRPEAYRRYDDDDFVLRGQGNVYFWYYGTLCCFLAGGDAWGRWNERLRTVLPAAQAADGSFPPIDVYAREAGDSRRDRSYTTAMCVLCLEIYYRYFTPLLLGR